MTASYLIAGLIALFGGVNTILLGVLISRQSKLEDKLDGKQDKAACDKQQKICLREFTNDDFWDVFNRHSHTGLPSDSKVTR